METDGGHVNFGIAKEQKLDRDLRKGFLITTQICFIKACGRHTPQGSRMGFHTNRANFPHREAAWWRRRHMLQQEAMGKDLREPGDHKPLKITLI